MALESCQAESGLDYSLLEGKWRLVYTTAADVVPIVGLDLSSYLPAGLPAPVVGDVFQRFSSVEDGRVENIIEFGVPPLTQEREGITFTVGARCVGAESMPSSPSQLLSIALSVSSSHDIISSMQICLRCNIPPRQLPSKRLPHPVNLPAPAAMLRPTATRCAAPGV